MDGSVVPADVVVDTVGLPRSTGQVQPSTTSAVTVRVRCGDPVDLPVETVVLPGAGRGCIVVARPDVRADSATVEVRATVPTGSVKNGPDEVARGLLAELARAGVQVIGEPVGVRVLPPRRLAARPRWSIRPGPGWLDLRSELADQRVRGLLHAAPRLTGGMAVPWQGLAAALAAHECGTVPRRAT
jgi:hypothetical protein